MAAAGSVPLWASLLLGIAAAIRGPIMLGGPVLIVLVLGWSAGRSKRLLLGCIAMFAVVVAADVVLQRVHKTANNRIESLYCVATDEHEVGRRHAARAITTFVPSRMTSSRCMSTSWARVLHSTP